jgi:hypothetical protein
MLQKDEPCKTDCETIQNLTRPENWLQGRDSNPRARRYERPDLPTELPCYFAAHAAIEKQRTRRSTNDHV